MHVPKIGMYRFKTKSLDEHSDHMSPIVFGKVGRKTGGMYCSFGCDSMHIIPSTYNDPEDNWAMIIDHEATHLAITKVGSTEDHDGYVTSCCIDRSLVFRVLALYLGWKWKCFRSCHPREEPGSSTQQKSDHVVPARWAQIKGSESSGSLLRRKRSSRQIEAATGGHSK